MNNTDKSIIKLTNEADVHEANPLSRSRSHSKGSINRRVESVVDRSRNGHLISSRGLALSNRVVSSRGDLEDTNNIAGVMREARAAGESTPEASSNKEKQTDNLSSASSIGRPFEYFADDDDEEQKQKSSKNEYFYYESEVNFSLSQYVTFLMFHICYFSFFGPLIIVLLVCVPRWRVLFVNMAFMKLDNAGFRQAFFWMAGILILVFFGLKLSTGKWKSIDLVLVNSVVNGSIYRSATIATKYATYPRKQIEKIYKVILSPDELRSEVTVIGWANQGAAIRYSELTHAIERYEIDRSTLRISFMSKVSDHCIEELQSLKKARQDGESVSVSRQVLKKQLTYYNSEYLMEFLIISFNRTVRPRCHNWVSRILGALLTVSVVIFRPLSSTYFYGDTWVEICIQLVALWNYYYMIFFQIKFFVQSIVDLRRKVYLMRQLSMVMSVKSTGKSLRKMLPTLNLIDEISLHSWLNMRRIGLDYGKKFVYRREILLPVFLLMMTLNFIGVWLIST